MPSAPASKAALTSPSSIAGTRTSGAQSVPAVEATMACRFSGPIGPCSRSIMTTSTPAAATAWVATADGITLATPRNRSPALKRSLKNTSPPSHSHRAGPPARLAEHHLATVSSEMRMNRVRRNGSRLTANSGVVTVAAVHQWLTNWESLPGWGGRGRCVPLTPPRPAVRPASSSLKPSGACSTRTAADYRQVKGYGPAPLWRRRSSRMRRNRIRRVTGKDRRRFQMNQPRVLMRQPPDTGRHSNTAIAEIPVFDYSRRQVAIAKYFLRMLAYKEC